MGQIQQDGGRSLHRADVARCPVTLPFKVFSEAELIEIENLVWCSHLPHWGKQQLYHIIKTYRLLAPVPPIPPMPKKLKRKG
jgi:hypothetical protein